MELSKKRVRDFGIDNAFTAEEMELADALLMLSHLDCFFVQWAVKRRRSAIARGRFTVTSITHQSKPANRSPLTALGLSWSESDEFDERADGLPPSSKGTSAKNVCRRRLPKKKTPKELKDMANTLSLENSRLKKEEEQLLKAYQELQEWNHHLKSQWAAHLNQRQEQEPPSTLQPTFSDKGSSHGTKTFASVDDLSRHNEHDSSDHFVGTLSTVYDEPLHVGVSVHQGELESPSGSDNGDSSRPTKGPSCFLSISDLNALTKAMCDMVPNGFREEMLLSNNKVVAAELTRVKYSRMLKARSR